MAIKTYCQFPFFRVIQIPASYLVLDMSAGPSDHIAPGDWAIGRYNERRPNIYTMATFSGGREIHMGIDFFGPQGSAVYCFAPGRIFAQAYREAEGDYGGTIITEHFFDHKNLWVLWGHLSHASLEIHQVGQTVQAGEILAYLGDSRENGGWSHPHLHLQLSRIQPVNCDLPGSVCSRDHAKALADFPDPQIVLGKIY